MLIKFHLFSKVKSVQCFNTITLYLLAHLAVAVEYTNYISTDR